RHVLDRELLVREVVDRALRLEVGAVRGDQLPRRQGRDAGDAGGRAVHGHDLILPRGPPERHAAPRSADACGRAFGGPTAPSSARGSPGSRRRPPPAAEPARRTRRGAALAPAPQGPPGYPGQVSSVGTRVFVARLAGTAVFDPIGDQVGRVRDVVVLLRPKGAPRAVGLVVEVPGRRRVFLPLTRVTSIDPGQVIIT